MNGFSGLVGLYTISSIIITIYQGSQGNYYWVLIFSLFTVLLQPVWSGGWTQMDYINAVKGFRGASSRQFFNKYFLMKMYITFVVTYSILYGIGNLFS